MESSTDKEWATKHLLDPLTSAEPADETGPGTSFGNTMANTTDRRSAAQIQDEKRAASTRVQAYPSPPPSAPSQQTAFPEYRDEAFGSTRDGGSPRQSSEIPTSTVPSIIHTTGNSEMPRRRSSLAARYAGDKSHRPLDILREENKVANRHLRRGNKVGRDSIDHLDESLGSYHHDGPYDATLMGRNLDPRYSPVAAAAGTNRQALRATPQEFIKDSIEGHRPLSGTASIPPGEPDRFGRVLNYREGPNLNVEAGWRRWEGITYHPDDIKGKGEPSYTIEKALKDHNNSSSHRRIFSDGAIEMTDRPRRASGPYSPRQGSQLRTATGIDNTGGDMAFREQSYSDWQSAGGVRRANTTGRRLSGPSSAIKSKFGSLRRRKPGDGRPVGQENAGGGGAFGAEDAEQY